MEIGWPFYFYKYLFFFLNVYESKSGQEIIFYFGLVGKGFGKTVLLTNLFEFMTSCHVAPIVKPLFSKINKLKTFVTKIVTVVNPLIVICVLVFVKKKEKNR